MEQSHRFPHRRLLGWVWLVSGTVILLSGGFGLFAIFRDPTGGYDFLPAFLVFVVLPFSLLCVLTGYALMADKGVARPLTVLLSSILAVVSGLLLVWGRTLVVFRYVPVPLLLALGIYGIVVVLRVPSTPPGRKQISR